MIKREELIKIGQFHKPHGVKGELTFVFTHDSFDEGLCPFLICEIDGIFVPFRMEEYRFKSNSIAFMKLKDIDSETQARLFIYQDVYFPQKYVSEIASDETVTWYDFKGYTLREEHAGIIGEIIDVDDTTINVLFVVAKGDHEFLIPATNDMIRNIDEEQKELFVVLPEGLLDI